MTVKDDYDYSHRLDTFTRTVVSTVRVVNIVCIIALLIISGENAAVAGRTSELKSGHELHYSYLIPALMSVPVWCTLAFFGSWFTHLAWEIIIDPKLPQRSTNLLRERSSLARSGICDLLFSIILTILIWLQSTFLPRPLGRCVKSGIMEIGKEEYHGRSYLDAIAKREGREADESGLVSGDARKSWCVRFVNSWRLEIALCVMMGGVGLLCLYGATRRIGVCSRAQTRYENRLRERVKDITVRVIEPAAAADASAVNNLQSHSQTLCNQTTESKAPAFSPVSTEKPTSAEYLAKILSQYGLLSVILFELRCSDIANLLYLSRDIRSVILAAGISPRGLLSKGDCEQRQMRWQKKLEDPNFDPLDDYFARFSCFHSRHGIRALAPGIFDNYNHDTPPPTPESFRRPLGQRPRKTVFKPCLSCGTVTCKACTRQSSPLDTSTIRHLRDCEPHCSQCFKAFYCYGPRARSTDDPEGYMLPESCEWGDVSAHKKQVPAANQPAEQEGTVYTDIFASSVLETKLRICQSCKSSKEEPAVEGDNSELKNAKLVSMNEYKIGCGRMRLVLGDMGLTGTKYFVKRANLECEGCQKGFKKGEHVWWVCKWCKRECVSPWHMEMEELIAA